MSRDSRRREVDRQLELMRAGAVEVYGEDDLRARLEDALERDRPLRVKLGMDPSAPDLHLGHTVVLRKLARFQELGHTPIFLVGDFTARIGDPSGRNKTRPVLEPEEVRKNAETYVAQVDRILDARRAEVRFNSEWMDRMTPADLVRLCSQYTVARILERDDFAKRYAAGDPIAVHEFLYPFVQAFDSVALEADVELGGTDQTFNLLMAREIQRSYGQSPQAVFTHPLLVGTDGREKMSKSLGNTIGIAEPAEEIYGKTMRISDPLMLDYLEILSGGEWEDLSPSAEAVRGGGGDPLALKHELAFRIAARFQGRPAAELGREHFARVVQRKQVPEDVANTRVELPAGASDVGLLEVLEQAGLPSRSEARRRIRGGGIQVDGERVADEGLRLGPGSYLIRLGKRRFSRVEIA